MKEMIIAIAILLIGFVLLIKGADFFVDGASSVAAMLKISPLIIGLTIVAMGTSLPELAVSVGSSIEHKNSLAISNILGSNMFNLMFICGVCSLFFALEVSDATLKRDLPLSIICAILLLCMGLIGNDLSRIDGAILIVIFIAYIIYMVLQALKQRKNSSSDGKTESGEEIKILPIWQCILYILGGAAAVKFGGDFVVNGASTIAEKLGMSETLVGLTICAVGTSLPELVTSIAASRKHQVDMALGNVVGSNIFNILMILGISALISPVEIIRENLIDVTTLIVFSLITLVFSITKKSINRYEGICMLVLYIGYMVYTVIR